MSGVLVSSPPQPHGVILSTSLPIPGLPPRLHSGRALLLTDRRLLTLHCLRTCEQESRWPPWSPRHSGPKSSGREESSTLFQFSLQIQSERLRWPRRSVCMTRCLLTPQTPPCSTEHTLQPLRLFPAFEQASLPPYTAFALPIPFPATFHPSASRD